MADGSLNFERIASIVEQIVYLRQNKIEVILISSGAVAAGRAIAKMSKKTSVMSAKQVWAAIGQVKLMATYTDLFNSYNINCGQVLTTKENFGDRRHYLNMQNCITAMLDNNVLPIVNENDTISVTELMFTDNDELSGLIASMMNCRSLFILSNIDGVYSGNPAEPGNKLIPVIDGNTKNLSSFIAPVKSGFGRGGMLTKCSIAQKISSQGIDVYIANGTRNNILIDIIEHKNIPYTHFVANTHKSKSVKKWLSHSDSFARGIVVVNNGAKLALLSNNATSVLFIGIVDVKGFFEPGDIVKVEDENGVQIAIGRAQYSSDNVKDYMGTKRNKPFIHYDYLTVLT